MPLYEEVNAEKYRRAATHAINEINSRGRLAIILGGSGLYIKALTHGLAPLPGADPKLREKLNAMSLDELRLQLLKRDPEAARKIDTKNRRRLVRALEICLLTGKPASEVVVPRRRDDPGLPGGLPPGTVPTLSPVTATGVPLTDRSRPPRRLPTSATAAVSGSEPAPADRNVARS